MAAPLEYPWASPRVALSALERHPFFTRRTKFVCFRSILSVDIFEPATLFPAHLQQHQILAWTGPVLDSVCLAEAQMLVDSQRLLVTGPHDANNNSALLLNEGVAENGTVILHHQGPDDRWRIDGRMHLDTVLSPIAVSHHAADDSARVQGRDGSKVARDNAAGPLDNPTQVFGRDWM